MRGFTNTFQLVGQKVLVLLIAVITMAAQLAWLNTAHVAAEGFTLSGYVKSGGPYGDPVGNVSIEVTNVSTGLLVGSYPSSVDGSYFVGGLSLGTYRVRVTPPQNTGLLEYVASVDVFSNTEYPIVLTSTPSSDVVFSGKMLLNGGAPGAYFQNKAGGGYTSMLIGGPNSMGSRYMDIDPGTGIFSVKVPSGDGYDILVPFYGGEGVMANGIQGLTPPLSLRENTYKVFNLNTQEHATPVSVAVTDQCGNTLPGSFLTVSVVDYFTIASGITAKAQYNPFLGVTDSGGNAFFTMQNLDRNLGGSFYARYQIDNVTYYAQRVFASFTPSDHYRVIIDVPSCTYPDVIAPQVGQFSWTINPKPTDGSTALSVGVADDISGVARGEYFIGDTDPGEGNGAAMNWDGTNLSTTFGTDFPVGVYKIQVRAQDNAGNWSDPISDYLVVYDPSVQRMTGRRTITPSLSNGDVLPGLASGIQMNAATFAFSVKYDGSGQVAGTSDMQLKYQTGTHCKNAAQAQNCHSFNLDANDVAWFYTKDTNNSTGVFQGTATLIVDGVTSQVTFRVSGVDGSRLSSTSPDSFEVRIFAQGDDPNTATPIYVINPTSITQGDIKII